MRRVVIGLAILAAALGLSWAIIEVGQAWGMVPVTALVGEVRTPTQAAAAETIFDIVIFLPLLIAGLIGGAIERRNAAALGSRPAAGLGLGVLIGFGGLSVSGAYAWMAGAMVPGSQPSSSILLLLWGAAAVLLQTGAEEVFFRGWLQPALAARWGMAAGIVAGALAFAALHIAGAPELLGPVPLLNLFLGGIMFGLLAALGRGIAAALGVHWAWNGSEQLIYGLDPNPGSGGFGSWIDRDLVGSPYWGGSADGLNGSVGMTFALLAILVPLAVLNWRRAGLHAATPKPA